jgi:hypothetical protein
MRPERENLLRVSPFLREFLLASVRNHQRPALRPGDPSSSSEMDAQVI